MGAVSADEEAGIAMRPTWHSLLPVAARDAALTRFLREELPPGVGFTAAGMTAAFGLCAEFNEHIWGHYVPTIWELILADRAGQLDQKIAQLNEDFALGK
jgi:hypothetical protein